MTAMADTKWGSFPWDPNIWNRDSWWIHL